MRGQSGWPRWCSCWRRSGLAQVNCPGGLVHLDRRAGTGTGTNWSPIGPPGLRCGRVLQHAHRRSHGLRRRNLTVADSQLRPRQLHQRRRRPRDLHDHSGINAEPDLRRSTMAIILTASQSWIISGGANFNSRLWYLPATAGSRPSPRAVSAPISPSQVTTPAASGDRLERGDALRETASGARHADHASWRERRPAGRLHHATALTLDNPVIATSSGELWRWTAGRCAAFARSGHGVTGG